MSNSSGNPKSPSIMDILRGLFNTPKPPSTPYTPPAPQPVAPPPDNTTDPARMVTSRVLLAIYNPVVDAASGKKLSQYMNWRDPDQLSNAFIQEILEYSGGLARYQIVQRIELNEFPAKTNGYRYDAKTYLDVIKGLQPPYKPEGVDYKALLTGLNVLPRIIRREIDEVWVFAFPQAGFYESTMGGTGAFWCNSEPMAWSSNYNRRFVVMGFSYERGVGEMLEAFGHRAESILKKTFAKTTGTANLYSRFARYDKEEPGQAGVGNIHYAPNSERDYDWGNPRSVKSNCYDWYNFPNFQGDVRVVNASEWGNGDLHAHHTWWLKHLPKVAGRTSGIANNWWQYIIDANLVNL